jgi:signal transduction histidine kinase/CheY-like chemotaxis protein/HPt (histidine-containing phosphotransfer) domain-containing protein
LLQGFREQVRSDALALQDANNTLEARVAQRTAELSASREEALAAARAKAAFLATMSHEIRTPLNGVVGMSALLAETSLDAEQRDYLQTIRISSDQLLSVINDILDFSKIESGKLELESEPFDLRNAVEEACDIAAPRAREKGLELIIDIPAAGPGAAPAAVVGDVTRLRQILINLVNNAVKFTARGEVTVHARQLEVSDSEGGAVIEFRVQDSGIGIPADRVGSLFDAFSQVDASTTRKYGGTGLGLAICLRLVELMGGRIGVESELGKGSTFWFTLPARATELPVAAPESGASVLRGSRALIVDDHPTNVRILRRQLELWGMEVASAESGGDALIWLAGRSVPDAAPATRPGWLPDVIITDMHMPEMDGVALARALRAAPAWRDIPLVLLSSGFMPSGDESSHLFDARLLKPARQAQLCLTLARCISSDAAVLDVAPRPAAGLRRHRTVLVADDNTVNLKVATAMLRKLGYDFETAVDGREAVATVARSMAQERPFSAILMDVSMPDVDGLDATRQILDTWGEKAPPVIALTAAALPEDQARCLAAGMVDYLTKPLHVAALTMALERWVPGLDAPAPGAGGRMDAVTLAPQADPATAPLVDFGRLEEFREFDDENHSLTREVIGMFAVEAPRRLAAIDAAIAASDAPALAGAAHALKGAAGNIGASALQLVSHHLEEDARQGVPPDAAARLERLRELWSSTQAVLSGWV